MKSNKFFLRLFLIIAVTLTVTVNIIGVWGIIKLKNKAPIYVNVKIGEINDEIKGKTEELTTIDAVPLCVKILIAYNIAMLLVIIYDIKRLQVYKYLEQQFDSRTIESKLSDIKEKHDS
ncbi:hypothetical protein AAEX28_12660 [Lentisphaerota bacterium WC36G]|nr:hypothetical protein LJT99_15480 [Lentisphaerae bacterium WC36]